MLVLSGTRDDVRRASMSRNTHDDPQGINETAVAGYTPQIESIFKRCFEALKDTFPYERIELLLASYLSNESQHDEEHDLTEQDESRLVEELDRWTTSQHEPIKKMLVPVLTSAAAAAFIEAFKQWMQKFGLNPGHSPAMMVGLAKWAKRRAPELLDLVDRTTHKHVVSVIKQGIKKRLSVREIMTELGKFFADTRPVARRAALAARAEVCNALNEGAFAANTLLGAKEKMWITQMDSRVCTLCDGNMAAGPIPMDRPFPSGHHRPKAHILCRCLLVYFGVTHESALATLADTV